MNSSRFKDIQHKEIFEYLSEINKEAYKDIYLLSNQVLSKNPISNTFFDDYMENKCIKPFKIHQIYIKIIGYYIKSILLYFQYLNQKLVYSFSQQKFDLKSVKDEIIIIDVIFLMNAPIENNEFYYDYFNGLNKILDNKKINYAFLPMFFSNVSLYKFYKILKEIKKIRLPVLTEFQLLSFSQLFELLYFIITYPIYLLKFTNRLNNNKMNLFLKYELIKCLDQVTFHSFTHYLKGKNLSSISCNRIKVFSKYENQTSDKNYYKGLRSGKTDVIIYGCQLFIRPFSLLNLYADINEISHGIVPDKIIVNGAYYLYKDKRINLIVGPSLRHKYIFRNCYENYSKNNLLIPLPYMKSESSFILKIVDDIHYSAGDIIIKFHPTSSKREYQKFKFNNAFISNEAVSKLLKNTMIVISNESGALVEAVSCGIPAIVINNKNKYLHNPLPELGRGIIWDIAGCADDVNKLIIKFQHSLLNENDKLLKYSKKYKEMFFTNPTEDKIIETFDLLN